MPDTAIIAPQKGEKQRDRPPVRCMGTSSRPLCTPSVAAISAPIEPKAYQGALEEPVSSAVPIWMAAIAMATMITAPPMWDSMPHRTSMPFSFLMASAKTEATEIRTMMLLK